MYAYERYSMRCTPMRRTHERYVYEMNAYETYVEVCP